MNSWWSQQLKHNSLLLYFDLCYIKLNILWFGLFVKQRSNLKKSPWTPVLFSNLQNNQQNNSSLQIKNQV